jgi:hypothetical protein
MKIRISKYKIHPIPHKGPRGERKFIQPMEHAKHYKDVSSHRNI